MFAMLVNLEALPALTDTPGKCKAIQTVKTCKNFGKLLVTC